MNWLAVEFAGGLGLLLGGVGAWLVYGALAAHGVEAAWLVGVVMGGGTALLARERSGMRAVIVTGIAAWTAAMAQMHFVTPVPGGLVDAARGFHATVTITRVLSFAACMMAAFWIGKGSVRAALRRPAPRDEAAG